MFAPYRLSFRVSISWTILCFALFNFNVASADGGSSNPNYDYLPPEDPASMRENEQYMLDLFGPPSHSGSYPTAKRRMYAKLNDSRSLYCGCKNNLKERTFKTSLCGYVAKNVSERSIRLEAEHVLPAKLIAEYSEGESCWVKHPSCGDARDCCKANDPTFKKAHNDLVNLMPTIGELNNLRNDHPYGIVRDEKRLFGKCDFEIGGSPKRSEPKKDIRGNVARVYMYMRNTYELDFPTWLETQIEEWDSVDPPDQEEIDRNTKIFEIQGSANTLLFF